MAERAKTNRKLTAELERLKRIFGMAHELTVAWIPGHARYVLGRKIGGEVVGKTIFVYAESEVTAINILRHEFLEHILVDKFVMPYKKLVNVLLMAFEEQAYSEKERLIRKLAHIVWGDEG